MDDFQYTAPTKIAIRGWPNQKQNFTKRRRKQPVFFSSLKDDQKKRILFKAVVIEEYWSVENIVQNAYTKSPENIGSVVLDAECNLEIIRDNFSHHTCAWIQSCVDLKLRKKLYICPERDRVDDQQLKMIGCDQCLEWYHYECVNMTTKKVPKNWFCSDCWSNY